VPALWVAHLLISNETAKKIISVHGIHPDDVRAAVECVTGLSFTWDDHPERGRRAIVKTRINQKPALVVLYLADAGWDDWWLRLPHEGLVMISAGRHHE
jgi:hypothetical protein